MGGVPGRDHGMLIASRHGVADPGRALSCGTQTTTLARPSKSLARKIKTDGTAFH